MRKMLILWVLTLGYFQAEAQHTRIALLKYSGGGDWYANPTSLPNLIAFCNKELHTNLDADYATVSVGDADLFNYPLAHMTGHGNVVLSAQEAQNLRQYMLAGGFVHVDDNYGIDPFFRREIKKVFPDHELEELPPDHPIFRSPYLFPKGLPKIHEHDNKPAQAFGIYHEGRLVLLYTFECDLGDGWESAEVHNDSPETRLKALRMGANIVYYVFSGR